MKTRGIALVLIVAGCGKGGTAGSVAVPAAVVQMLGVHSPGSVLVHVESVALAVDNQAIPAQLNGGDLDLGQEQHAWDLLSFTLPPNAHDVSLSLQFLPQGTIDRAGKTQTLDLSGPPLSVVADATQVGQRGVLTLQVDLARSLVDQGGQVALLPDFTVAY